MKLFQQLLVAPAALGLMAPMAAQAADLNIDGVSDYSAAGEQVTSVSQFSDVYPTDWAYQALSSLTERYGCVAGYPGGTFGGNRSITRYEAAALLNACLDRVTEVSDDVKRLLSEFGPELAVLKGRVDGIEARVGDMAAGQFSTTTKLSGVATFVVGANGFSGDDAFASSDTSNPRHANAGKTDGGTVLSYDLQLELATSFTGEDLLNTVLRAGNFGSNGFGGAGYTELSTLETGFDSGDQLKVDKLWYSFPWGDDFTVIAGPLVGAEDMLAVNPSLYGSETILDVFTYSGAPGTYGRPLGGGAGLSWNQGDIDVSANYVSTNASNSNPASGGGLLTEAAGSSAIMQVAYSKENWGVAVAYNYASTDHQNILGGSTGTSLANAVHDIGPTNSYSLSTWWSPAETGLIPTLSAGWGINTVEDNDDRENTTYDSATTQSWAVGMEWEDAFMDGNIFGFAFGQPNFVTEIDYDSSTKDDDAEDGNYAMEWWYKIQVSDNITVTPAIFYLSRPFGDQTDQRQDTHGGDAGSKDSTFRNFGALVKTTFTF
ncbi:iron uptake porin [Prochlorococcus sp. MIT 1341]|uniref:iron uptake porin n=1 Tax=Prochlorococcus sp. MIT 1341 TaxID=3096221 RepID=UPI002A754C6E|nr:iron uptake porin [Prochlorococcus sp. MIT 1341]